MYKGCPKCGKLELEQVTQGHATSDVVGITVDGGVLCNGFKFKQHKYFPTIFRCKSCFEPVHEREFNPQYEEVVKNNEQNDNKKPD